MTDTEYKVYVNRLRRMAARQGLKVVKSRSRDPRALDYGTFSLTDAKNNSVTGDRRLSARELHAELLK